MRAPEMGVETSDGLAELCDLSQGTNRGYEKLGPDRVGQRLARYPWSCYNRIRPISETLDMGDAALQVRDLARRAYSGSTRPHVCSGVLNWGFIARVSQRVGCWPRVR